MSAQAEPPCPCGSRYADISMPGQEGLSAQSLRLKLGGSPSWRFHRDHPSDPADLHRCVHVLDLNPGFRARIAEMAEVSPEWERLAARWPELERALYREVAGDGRTAPATYKLMQEIIKGAPSPHRRAARAAKVVLMPPPISRSVSGPEPQTLHFEFVATSAGFPGSASRAVLERSGKRLIVTVREAEAQ